MVVFDLLEKEGDDTSARLKMILRHVLTDPSEVEFARIAIEKMMRDEMVNRKQRLFVSEIMQKLIGIMISDRQVYASVIRHLSQDEKLNESVNTQAVSPATLFQAFVAPNDPEITQKKQVFSLIFRNILSPQPRQLPRAYAIRFLNEMLGFVKFIARHPDIVSLLRTRMRQEAQNQGAVSQQIPNQNAQAINTD